MEPSYSLDMPSSPGDCVNVHSQPETSKDTLAQWFSVLGGTWSVQ